MKPFFFKSGILDDIYKSNALPFESKKQPLFIHFSRIISNTENNVSKYSKYLNYGKRVANIIHIKLRHNCLLIMVYTGEKL